MRRGLRFVAIFDLLVVVDLRGLLGLVARVRHGVVLHTEQVARLDVSVLLVGHRFSSCSSACSRASLKDGGGGGSGYVFVRSVQSRSASTMLIQSRYSS